jgi:hypothetical protein
MGNDRDSVALRSFHIRRLPPFSLTGVGTEAGRGGGTHCPLAFGVEEQVFDPSNEFTLWKMPLEIYALMENADDIDAIASHAIEQKVRPSGTCNNRPSPQGGTLQFSDATP